MSLNINKGFESMIPKSTRKEKKPSLSNLISFKIFKKRFTISLEVKEEVSDDNSSV